MDTTKHIFTGATVYTPARMYGSPVVGTATVVATGNGGAAHIRLRGKLGTMSATPTHLFATRAEAAGYWERMGIYGI